MSLDKAQLQKAYDNDALRRNDYPVEAWKQVERQRFTKLFLAEGKERLLEIGAGAGKDSLYFMESGMKVTAVDLSPEMVKVCREKGIEAEQLDFYELPSWGRTFQGIYGLNCLLHVPKAELRGVLEAIHDALEPHGLFYMGVYGGKNSEGVWNGDWCEPKRFFSFYTHEALQAELVKVFDIVSFEAIDLGEEKHIRYFQSVIMRKKEG